MNRSEIIIELERERDNSPYKAGIVIENAIKILKQSWSIESIISNDLKSTEPAQSNGRHTIQQKYDGYSAKWTLRKKIPFIIKAENRFMHIREIAKIMNELEPRIPESEFIPQISPTLSTLKKISEYNLTNKRVGKSNIQTVWGAKTWLDQYNAIIPEYMYDKTVFEEEKPEIMAL